MTKKILVIGSSGFIGKHLVWELEKHKDFIVTAADIAVESFSKATSIACDILDAENINTIFEKVKPNFVYNLAGFSNLSYANEHPKKVIELNILGNLNILEACYKYNTERFIYASSAYAVGDAGGFYGFSKAHSEKLVELYQQQFGLNFTILRYGSIYGSTASHNNYIYNLISDAIKSGEINHDSDGEEVREYIHVDDVARLSVDILCDNKYENSHLILTGQERYKRKELFETINEIMGNTLKISYADTTISGRYKSTPYSFKTQQHLKLTANPFVDLGQGLTECIASIQQNEESHNE